MNILLKSLALLSLLLSGAIFGFFYAWVCSTMWGLDQLPPNTAIAAMQAMNASVRNAVFAPSFFGAPLVLLLTALVAWIAQARASSVWFAGAGVVLLVGGLILTVAVNVPMNQELAKVALPLSEIDAETVWSDYSAPWQFWNQIRTGFAGLAVLACGVGLLHVPRHRAHIGRA